MCRAYPDYYDRCWIQIGSIIGITLCLMMEDLAVSGMSVSFFEVPTHVDSFRFSGHSGLCCSFLSACFSSSAKRDPAHNVFHLRRYTVKSRLRRPYTWSTTCLGSSHIIWRTVCMMAMLFRAPTRMP